MENTEYKDYFISRLKEKQEFNVCYMTTDNSRHLLIKLNTFNKNCHIEIYNNLSDFIFKNNNGLFKRKYMNQNYTNFDLIILDDSDIKNCDWKHKYIEDMAIRLSQISEKQVTIGYIFTLPFDKSNTNNRKHLKMIILNQKEVVYDEEILIESRNVCNILDIVSYKHNNIEKPKTLKK